jgi:hypothetical protein
MKILCRVFILSFMLAGCKNPYLPPIIASNSNYLVIEGVVNSGQDSTILKISRTVNLSGNTNSKPELNAVVTVESDQTAIYQIPEIGPGKYASPALNLDNTRKYHVRIKTSAGKEYLSDFAAINNTPPIDSVGFNLQNTGLQIYVNTHDPANNTRYYRWEYEETWRFHAKYGSAYITNGTAIIPRRTDQMIFDCFGNSVSSTIVLGSSAKLARDVIYQNPVTQISSTSEKLETRYSILVRQYALSADAYNFWVNLKKNTEQLGTIFDAQPSNINGNIHCINDPGEPVIGYISVTNVQQKRIFIDNSQLPAKWVPTYPYNCKLDTALFCRPVSLPCQNDVLLFMIPIGSFEIPTTAVTPPNGAPVIIGYMGTSRECVDCTIRGATKQPAFWK